MENDNTQSAGGEGSGVITDPAPAEVIAPAAPGKVTAIVPTAYKFTHADHSVVEIPAGVQELDPAVADHWWSVANGVTKYVPGEVNPVEPPKAPQQSGRRR